MNYSEFIEKIVSMVGEDMGSGFTASVQRVIKGNNTTKNALVIHKKDRKESMVPLIYLEPYFEIYEQGQSMEDCVRRIKNSYWEKAEDKNMAGEVKDMVVNWKKAKMHIYPFLISRLNNEELLESLVHREWLDLAACYMVRLDARTIYSHFKISKNLCQSWGVDEEALYQQAMENMKKDGYTVTGMESIIGELDPEQCHTEQRGETEDMYIVTNAVKWYGAAGLLRDVYFLCHKFGPMNFYILPSSIHEIILVPDKGKLTAEEINGMVREVNKEQVLPEERLADHAYYYDWSKGKIQIVE